MPGSTRSGIEMGFTFATNAKKPRKQASREAFRVLVLGDFGGRSGRQNPEPALRIRARAIDPSDIDTVLASIAPRIELEVGEGSSLGISFRTMDDFHPAEVLKALEVFTPLRDLRRQLLDPRTSAETVARLRGRAGLPEGSQAAAPSPEVAQARSPAAASASKPSSEGDNDTLARLFGKPAGQSSEPQPTSQSAASKPTSVAAGLDALVRPLLASHVTAAPDPRSGEVLASVDGAISALMRTILHHPHFKALEATWRALAWLCQEICDGENVEVAVLDISKDELAGYWAAEAGSDGGPLAKFLRSAGTPESGQAPWSLLIADYVFRPTAEDAFLLRQMAEIAAEIGAPFVAGAEGDDFAEGHPSTTDEDKQAWASLCQHPSASYVGLALPHFLVRLPYGKATEPVDAFQFEELSTPSDLSGCLFGNAAFAVARLIGGSFVRDGWEFSLGEDLEVSGLPVYAYRDEDGESTQAPCAEVWVSQAKAEELGERGVMVFQAIRGRDAMRLTRFQSVHAPTTRLEGRWG